MASMIYLDQENGTGLGTPAIKSRSKLQFAPYQLLETPLKVKACPGAPLQSGRRALGTVNKIVATPAASLKGEGQSKPAGTQKVKMPSQPVGEDYPEIEKCFPYNPSDFEIYSVPDEVHLSHLSLAGLAKQLRPVCLPEERFNLMDPCLPLSPLKMPSENCKDDLEAFLQTINELTVDLPPECD